MPAGTHLAPQTIMDTLFIPKKFEIQFRRMSEDQYVGALVIDGREMGVGTPKTLDEITAFLMPHKPAMPSPAIRALTQQAA